MQYHLLYNIRIGAHGVVHEGEWAWKASAEWFVAVQSSGRFPFVFCGSSTGCFGGREEIDMSNLMHSGAARTFMLGFSFLGPGYSDKNKRGPQGYPESKRSLAEGQGVGFERRVVVTKETGKKECPKRWQKRVGVVSTKCA
jgi:hypothetical protein